MKIGIIGAGRLGICFALLLDRGGYDVIASDIRANYIAGLQRREIQTNEPGVADMLRECSIDFTTDTRRVIQESDVIYVMAVRMAVMTCQQWIAWWQMWLKAILISRKRSL
jgi:UDP-glucose 6-dehydrogenase